MDNSLINNVLNLNKRTTIPKPSRTEPTTEISEFNLVKSGTRKEVVLHELTKALKQNDKHAKLQEKIQNFKSKIKRLPKPLEKPKADRIKRSIGYDNVKQQLDRYNAVVTSNRASNYLTFPAAKDIAIETGKDFSGYRVKSELQKRLEKVTPKQDVEVIHLEKKSNYSLTMQEMLAKRKDMAKMKIMEGYKAAKARRQNKIKSKKYHRIQRRENVKNQIKDFEQLQASNPEEALKKLQEIDRVRAEERASLRHRSTGKWAKNKQIKAKYDTTKRQELAEQLTLSRELTQKVNVDQESESEDEAVDSAPVVMNNGNNPWVDSIKTSEEVDSFISSYRKFWDKKNTQSENNIQEAVIQKEQDVLPKKPQRKKKQKFNVVRCVATSPWDVGVLSDTDEDEREQTYSQPKQSTKSKHKQKVEFKTKQTKSKKKQKTKNAEDKKSDFERLSFKKNASRPIIDEPLHETNDLSDNSENLKILSTIFETRPNHHKNKTKISNIDPNDIINTKAVHLESQIPDLLAEEDEEASDQGDIIAEAFEDDDVVADFKNEKNKEIEGDKPENIDLYLPGWGSWGGPGIKSCPKKRANKRFMIKFPTESKRRDENKGNLIISEKGDDKIKPHLVSEIPFPFTTVKDFEASIRAPIGNTFVPETAYKKLIRPAVKTKMGAIIEPMSEEILLKTKA